jgi:hypothetical protein
MMKDLEIRLVCSTLAVKNMLRKNMEIYVEFLNCTENITLIMS